MQQKVLAGRRLKGRAGIQKLIEKRRPTLLGVKRLLNQVGRMVKVVDMEKGTQKQQQRNNVFVRKVYGARTAEEMANRERIIVGGKNGKAIWGCHQQSLVIFEALKELEAKYPQTKLNPRIARFHLSIGTPHSIVLFESKGIMYEADPFYGTLTKVDKYRKEGLESGTIKIIEPKPISYEQYKKEKKAWRNRGQLG